MQRKRENKSKNKNKNKNPHVCDSWDWQWMVDDTWTHWLILTSLNQGWSFISVSDPDFGNSQKYIHIRVGKESVFEKS